MLRPVGVIVVVLVGAVAFGQPAGPGELICPVDGCHFRVPVGQPGDRAGGTDSDQCPHDRQGETLSSALIVCPRCNYATSRAEFTAPVSDEQRRLILRALATSRYRGVTNVLTEIPSWERFRLAATCAAALGKEKEQLNCVEFAAWSVRVESCRAATVAYSSRERMITPIPTQLNEWMSTRGIGDVIREIVEKSAAAGTAAEKNRLLLHLAMMYQRAGFAAKRNEVLQQLKPAGEADALLAGRLERFRTLVAVEADFQQQVVILARKRLAGAETRWDRATLNYLLADALRRLRKDAEALEQYRAARKLMTEPTQTRRLTDHFLSMLAPGEPLPTPVPEEKTGDATAPAPTDAPKE
ncbi:MAG TPA: hypothetical protein VMZ92_01100 [Planctomycetota bacterium]|nr:hypothetical protein [Planctomycetota bacterium]